MSTDTSTAAEGRREQVLAEEQKVDVQDSSHLQSWRLGIVVTSLCLGAVLYGLDMNIIGVAVPVITTEFHSLDDIAWYSAAYLLTITAFQPFFGNIYKYFPAKFVYIVSIVLFEGFGAAGLLQGALGIITFIVKLERIPMFQGIVAAAAAANQISNVPIGGAVAICVFLFCNASYESNKENIRLPLREKLRHLDLISTVVFLGSIVSLLLILQWGGQTVAWNSATSIGLFVCFGVLIIVFIALQWKLGEYATMPFRIIKVRSIYMGAMVLFTLGVASISLAFYLPLYFQAIQGVSATKSGVNMLAYVAPTIVSIGITGALVSKFGFYLGGAVAVSVGQNLLLNGLRKNIPKHISPVSPISAQQVIDAGAGGLSTVTQKPIVLQQLREAYAESLRGTFILALVGTCLALPFAAGMQWLNIKKIAEERRMKAEVSNKDDTVGLKGDIELASREASHPTSPV
ncbi:hypothetical protein N0V90_001440 [Kalmusia sp. IMI 367209]|nr:hypothetical protein N0V90_001440 [Kalmusia sp. IMI 367209]